MPVDSGTRRGLAVAFPPDGIQIKFGVVAAAGGAIAQGHVGLLTEAIKMAQSVRSRHWTTIEVLDKLV